MRTGSARTQTKAMEYLPSTNHEMQPGYPANSPGYPSYLYAENMHGGGAGDHQSDPEGKGLIDYWRLLKRRRGTLLLAAFAGVLVAVLITVPQTPVYRARTTLEVQSINNDFLNAKQIIPIAEPGTGVNSLADIQTQIEIVQSEDLIDNIVDKYKPAHRLGPLEDPGITSELRKLLNLPAPTDSDLDYRIRRNAMKNLTVRQIGQTRVIEALYNSTDPSFSARFLNDLSAAYIESNMDARWRMSQRTSEWLSTQLDEMRVKLERSEYALEAYARKSGLIYTAPPNGVNGSGDKTNVSEEKLRQLQTELSKAMADRATAQSRYEIARSAAPDALADVLNDSALRDLQAKLIELRRQEADLITIYTPKNEKVLRIQSQIAPLEEAFAKGRKAILDRIHNDYDTAISRERLLQTDYSSQSAVVSEQAEKSIQYNILKREVDSNQQLYENMLQQVKQASASAAIRASNIRVVDPARIPLKVYSPDYLLNCSLGLFSGLLVGISLIVMRDQADRTLRHPGDVALWTNSPELGIIPSATAETGGRANEALRKVLSPVRGTPGEASEAAAAVAGGGPDNLKIGSVRTADNPEGRLQKASGSMVELMTWSSKPSMFAESFYAAAASVMFRGENGSRPRLLVFTSSSPCEGKTTVVSNLAIAMAGARQRVLVIDADMRKPRMHELYGLPNERGLSSLLAEESSADGLMNADTRAGLDGLVMKTFIPYLSVLTSGPSTSAAKNLLYSAVLADLFKKFRLEYDMILVDTPPMLSMSDSRIAGRLADAVVLVARVGQTTKEAAVAAHQRFADDRIKVLGTILNDWDPRKSPDGYYGYHHGSYYGGKKYSGYHGYYAKK
jgi:succinoglycan biosynthesis transport protein ExoP